MTIEQFASILHEQQLARLLRETGPTFPNPSEYVKITVKPGTKYTKVDVGTSGKYMVVNETGEIYGIKAYGVIHLGHFYGTLDTINDWNWGGYAAVRKPICPNCDQWQHDGDCLNECAKRGFAAGAK